jgi:aminoglycoside phosphotransferase (APT) family kinase protein
MRRIDRFARSPSDTPMDSVAAPAPDSEDSAATAIARWLAREARARDVRVARFEQLPGGAIQENWMLDVSIDGGPWNGAHEWVLRTDSRSTVPASLTRAQEFAVLRVAHEHGVIVPQPLFLCTDAGVTGRQFFIMKRVAGIAAGHRLTREAGLLPHAEALAETLGVNLGRLHAVAPPHAALDSVLAPPKAQHALATIGEYRAYLDTLKDAYPALEWALRWCENHAPTHAPVTLIHRDFRTGNYMVDAGRLTGILDWEFAGWGDPREDIGWFSARCWRFARADLEAGGIAPIEPFLRGYESASGRHVTRSDLEYWQIMAHVRWAIIALQQAQRHIAGGERSLELALTGRIVHELEYEVIAILAKAAR